MASSFLPFRSLIVTVRTSNKNQKGFLSKKFVQNCFPPDKSPVSDLTFPKSTQDSSDITSDAEYKALFSEPKIWHCARQRRR